MPRRKKVDMEEKSLTIVPPALEELEMLETSLDSVKSQLLAAQRELDEKKQEMKDLEMKKYHAPVYEKRELDEQEKSIVERQLHGFTKNAGLKAKIEAQREYDNQMVTGRFINRKQPGGTAVLTYSKYPDDFPTWKHFKDGCTYTIKRGYADQINEHYHTPAFIKNEGSMEDSDNGTAIHSVDTSDKKYAFVPVGFG